MRKKGRKEDRNKGRQQLRPNIRQYPGICVQRLRNITNLCQDSLYYVEIEMVNPEYEPSVLPLKPRRCM